MSSWSYWYGQELGMMSLQYMVSMYHCTGQSPGEVSPVLLSKNWNLLLSHLINGCLLKAWKKFEYSLKNMTPHPQCDSNMQTYIDWKSWMLNEIDAMEIISFFWTKRIKMVEKEYKRFPDDEMSNTNSRNRTLPGYD